MVPKINLKIILPIILLIIIFWSIFHDFGSVLESFKKVRLLPLLGAYLVLLIVPILTSLGWCRIISALGYQVKSQKAIKVWIISSIGRYFPGVIWQYVGRIELAKKDLGIPRQISILSLIIESYMALVSAAFLSVFTFFFISDQLLEINFLKYKFVVAIFLVPLLLFHPVFAKKLLTVLQRFFKASAKTEELLGDFYQSLWSIPYFLLNFILHGVALYLLVLAITAHFSFYQLLEMISFYSAAWILGYVVIFAPAGLGVTEGTLTYLLSSLVKISVSASLAIIYRFLMSISELLIFLIVLLW